MPTASDDGPATPGYRELLARAEADESVVGVVAFGSRAAGPYVTDRSDVDAFVIVDGSPDQARAWSTSHGSAVEIWAMTLDGFRTHALPSDDAAWNRPALIRARVDLDKLDGEIARIVDRKRRLAPEEARATADLALDDAINSIYRALRNIEGGRHLAGRLDAVESIGPLLTTVFALEGRVRPFNKWLLYELLAAGPSAGRLRAAFRMLEAASRPAGLGAVVDGWEPDVAWLRGEAAFRS